MKAYNPNPLLYSNIFHTIQGIKLNCCLDKSLAKNNLFTEVIVRQLSYRCLG